MQQVAEQLITGNTTNTEHIITNNTGRSFLLLAQMQAGSGDIHAGDGNTTWTESGSWGSYNYFSFAGKRGNFINLNHKDKNFSVVGGSGGLENILTRKENKYYQRHSDLSNTWYKWEHRGWDYYNTHKIAREGQKKHVVLFFKAGESIRINFTSFGSSGEKGFVRLTPLV